MASTGLATINPADLATWGDRKLDNAIRSGVKQAGAHLKNYEETATITGIFLVERKRRLEHGEWLPWLAEHFDGHRDTAAKYMRMAEEWVAQMSARPDISELSAETPEFSQEPEEVDAEPVDEAEEVGVCEVDLAFTEAGARPDFWIDSWYTQGKGIEKSLTDGRMQIPRDRRESVISQLNEIARLARRVEENIEWI
jgi:hypothetical protein